MKKTLRVFTSRVSASIFLVQKSNGVRYLIALLILFGAFVNNQAIAQNALVGSGFTSGWGGGGCPTGNGNFNYFGAGQGTTYIYTGNATGTGTQYWRFGVDWGGTTGQYTITPGSNSAVSTNTTYNLNMGCTTSGALDYNVGSTSYNYIFKTLNAGSSPTGTFVFFEVQGAVRTVSSVTQSPTAGNIYPGASVTVTANLSGAFSTGQAVYLRYTNNGYTTSTVVNMTGSSTTYTATIPASTNTVGSTISYYVFTSGPAGGGLASNGSNADLYTINANNNSGSNYSYTVSTSYITTQNGDWNTGATWLTGSVPNGGVSTIINNVVTCNSAVTNAPGSVTINSGQSLTFANASGALSTTTLTNNGTLAFTAAGNLTISSTGTFTNNGAVNGGSGTVTFSNGGVINGSATTFNNLTLTTGTLTLSTVPTINGTLLINGGNVTAAPIYGAASTLAYGVTYGRYIEWSATAPGTIGTTPGYPNNVNINSGTLTLYNSGQTGGGALAGNLTIGSGTTFTMAGYGSTISVGGSWSDAGTFTPGTTATVSMAGGAAQTIAKTGGETFYNLTINNTAGGVSLSNPVTVTNALTLTSGVVTTTSSNTLSVTNTATTGVNGGSTNAYVSGPLNWTLPSGLSASGSSYNFPVGGTGYLPFALTTLTTGGTGPVIQVQASNSGSGGTADGSSLTSISSTDFWKASVISGNYTSGSVSLTQQSAISPSNAIGQSASQGGTYSSLAGTIGTNGISNSNVSTSLSYFTFGSCLNFYGSE